MIKPALLGLQPTGSKGGVLRVRLLVSLSRTDRTNTLSQLFKTHLSNGCISQPSFWICRSEGLHDQWCQSAIHKESTQGGEAYHTILSVDWLSFPKWVTILAGSLSCLVCVLDQPPQTINDSNFGLQIMARWQSEWLKGATFNSSFVRSPKCPLSA